MVLTKKYKEGGQDGRIRFIELIEKVENWRKNDTQVNYLANYILKECREKKFRGNIDEDSDKKMTAEDCEKERRWILKNSNVKGYS